MADGKHLLADVVTSVGVAAGILLAWATGWWVLDPALAALVALNILWSGSRVIRDSLVALMDEAVPEGTLQTIRDVISQEAGGAMEAHDLRTRPGGSSSLVMRKHAHVVCDRVRTSPSMSNRSTRPSIAG